MKKIIMTISIVSMLMSVPKLYSVEKYDLSSPERVVELFFKMKKDKLDIAQAIFISDYNEFFKKYDDKMHEEKYTIIKTFQSKNAPSNIHISLVKVKDDGTLYYVLYFVNNNGYRINDMDRVFIPNPADFPGIEHQIISTLTNNIKAFKTKK
ncbi:MAG TPA: hypothetical protein PK624_12880 [Spirochaetota bacterium]|nr:hypothetical protein [Spirochaetota bacterium]HOR45680.1 hypothetical protein [Spirochaetota bacterium]HPK57467.1 hypothetical protein [Spirochaetota bacterium]